MPVSTVVTFLPSITLACLNHLSLLDKVIQSPTLLWSPHLAKILNNSSKPLDVTLGVGWLAGGDVCSAGGVGADWGGEDVEFEDCIWYEEVMKNILILDFLWTEYSTLHLNITSTLERNEVKVYSVIGYKRIRQKHWKFFKSRQFERFRPFNGPKTTFLLIAKQVLRNLSEFIFDYNYRKNKYFCGFCGRNEKKTLILNTMWM